MIPIGDDRLQNARTPFVTWTLILINVLVFIYELRLDDDSLQEFIYHFGATPVLIMEGKGLHGLFTSMFLHAGWLHLIGNMLFLWVFGDNIEEVLGHMGFIIFYLLGGLVAAAAHVYFNLGSEAPSLGASGAISACLGAYLVMFPRSRIRMLVPLGFFFFTVRVTAWLFLIIWIVIQVVSSRIPSPVEEAQGTGVAWWAHIGGFVYGVVAGLIFMGRARKIIVLRED